jgi:hypothetical protein
MDKLGLKPLIMSCFAGTSTMFLDDRSDVRAALLIFHTRLSLTRRRKDRPLELQLTHSILVIFFLAMLKARRTPKLNT